MYEKLKIYNCDQNARVLRKREKTSDSNFEKNKRVILLKECGWPSGEPSPPLAAAHSRSQSDHASSTVVPHDIYEDQTLLILYDSMRVPLGIEVITLFFLDNEERSLCFQSIRMYLEFLLFSKLFCDWLDLALFCNIGELNHFFHVLDEI